ncbi:MAG: hypothetical protein HY474_01725 [Candidatus Sungbacteria bacterium]|uniref:Sulfatase N-terminal domain-containing protein n=1 Tax=Candidatus Sungiibacteriota bacterium TaxID=2750080 RepID=A0A932YWG2_9BACT|nr:hypothetical protein [Candidatus Sungbacteria bacterium]
MTKASFIHPILFAVFPVLFLFAYNRWAVAYGDVLIPMAAAIMLAVLLRWLVGLIIRDGLKAGIIASVFLFVFFFYGHVYTWLNEAGVTVAGLELGRHRYLFPMAGAVLAFAAVGLSRARRNFDGLTRMLAVVSLTLVLFAVAGIGWQAVRAPTDARGREARAPRQEPPALKAAADSPDIYVITFDGYANRGTLQEVYHFDNREIYDYLEGKGFFVPTHARPNYARTLLSLTSELNMKYLGDIAEQEGKYSKNYEPLSRLLEDNEVARFLKGRGYTIVNISSFDSPVVENPYADLNFAGGLYRSSEFYVLVLKTTILDYFVQRFVVDDLRPKVLYAFDKLKEMPAMAGPKFVTVHVLPPHPPYLFGPDGERPAGGIAFEEQRDVWKRRQEYVDQVMFINKKMEEIVDVLLTRSATPPVIILQSDHGSAALADWERPSDAFLRERLRNFQAYYLPRGGEEALYDSMTMVNAFRIILNYYFGADYELLPDRSYFSPRDYYYNFRDVTDVVRYE